MHLWGILRQERRSHLKEVDPVAYVRFASVYRQFKDIDELRTEIDQLARKEPGPPLTPSARPPQS